MTGAQPLHGRCADNLDRTSAEIRLRGRAATASFGAKFKLTDVDLDAMGEQIPINVLAAPAAFGMVGRR